MAYQKNTLKGFAGPRRSAPSSPIQAELRNIESLYRSALSGAVVAKARYLALQEGASTQPPSPGRIQCGSSSKRVAVFWRGVGQDSRLWSMK